MEPDDEPQTTLSKWPFILGDVLLVGAALAIAILGQWQLTNWQVGACVAAVALGACLFVLPYIVEYQVRVREEKEDHAAHFRILERQVRSLDQSVDALDARTRSLAEELANIQRPDATLAELVDRRIEQLEAKGAAQAELIEALEARLGEIALQKRETPAVHPEELAALRERVGALESRPATMPPEALPAEPAELQKEGAEGTAEPEAESGESLKQGGVFEPESPVKPSSPLERPKRETRQRHMPKESRLLKRAISENGDQSSAAVSRIIGTRLKERGALPGADSTPEPEPTPALEPEPEKPAAHLQEPSEGDSSGDAKESVTDEAVAAHPETPATTPEASPELEPAEAVGPFAETNTVEPAGEAPADEPEPPKELPSRAKPERKAESGEEAELLFDPQQITSPVMKTRARKNDAVLTATVFIGIGNKPYLRGSGAGLSWERGMAMEFQEIGKWRWVAPAEMDEPVEVQIYRNDEDADRTGRYKLEPGQKLEVAPVF